MSMRLVKSRLAAAVITGVAALAIPTITGVGSAQASSEVVQVYSPSMDKNIPVEILRAAGSGPAPTLYLLDGLRAPDDNSGWLINTDAKNFFANKHVNVAVPFGGGGTFYSDWEQDDPKLGHVRWETFLTKELPAYMKGHFDSDGVNNAVAGLSMSGTSALNLATHHPDFYKAVASFSGYPTVTAPGFAQGIQASVAEMGGNPFNMWGVWPSPSWFANDPILNVGALKDMGVYVSAGSGGAGADATVDPTSDSFDAVKFAQMVPLETASGISSRLFITALQAANIKTQTNISAVGIHWWNYWQTNLHDAWDRTIAPSLGVK